jgi:hypothetical protein
MGEERSRPAFFFLEIRLESTGREKMRKNP